MLRGTRPLLNAVPRLAPTKTPVLGRPFPKASSLSQTFPRLRAPFSTKPPLQPNTRDVEFEKEVAQRKLKADPEHVSVDSSVRHVLETAPTAEQTGGDVKSGAMEELEMVKDTFALDSVPREAYALGLAGTLPYLATSISTVYLSWDLKTQWPTDSNFLNSFMVSHETATQWLAHLEPLQIGYGAVIISFLGAIHWGLEWAEKKPSHERTQYRYAVGLLAPAIAWPTVVLPLEWALTAQFLTFSALYMTDSRATTRGWAPGWYSTYRFVLTAIVGVSIVITLIARAKIEDKSPRITTDDLKKIGQHAPQLSYANWSKMEAEEKEKLKQDKEKLKKESKKDDKGKKKEDSQAKQEDIRAEKGGKAASKKVGGEEEEQQDESKDGKSDSDDSDDGDDGDDKESESQSDDKDDGKTDEKTDAKKDEKTDAKKDEKTGKKKDDKKDEKDESQDEKDKKTNDKSDNDKNDKQEGKDDKSGQDDKKPKDKKK